MGNILSTMANDEDLLPVYGLNTRLTPWTILTKHCPRRTVNYIKSFTTGWYVENNMICPYSNLTVGSSSKVFYPLSTTHELELRWINGGATAVHTIIESIEPRGGSLFWLNHHHTFDLDNQCTAREWTGVLRTANKIHDTMWGNKESMIEQAKERYKQYKFDTLENESRGYKDIGFSFGEYAPFELKITRFYASPEWIEARNQLFADNPSCIVCESTEKLNGDHIKPLRYNWHLRLDPDNLQTMCNRCNREKGASSTWDLELHRDALNYRIKHGIKTGSKGRWSAYTESKRGKTKRSTESKLEYNFNQGELT
jgi:hypothetical protein